MYLLCKCVHYVQVDTAYFWQSMTPPFPDDHSEEIIYK